jgi:hypothetical protein
MHTMQPGDIEQDPAAEKYSSLVNAVFLKPAASLGLLRIHAAEQSSLMRNVSQGIDMGPSMGTRDDQINGARGAIRKHIVAVTVEQREMEAWMVSWQRHARFHRLPEIVDSCCFDKISQDFSAFCHSTLSRSTDCHPLIAWIAQGPFRLPDNFLASA